MAKHFLDITDFNRSELEQVFDLSRRGSQNKSLKDELIVLVFEKPSLRTVLATERAVFKLGGIYSLMRTEDFKPGVREDIKDVVRTISCYSKICCLRVNSHSLLASMVNEIENFKLNLSVVNLLSDLAHPCQALADFLTIYDYFSLTSYEEFKDLKIAYIGDVNNVCRSLAEVCLSFGATVKIGAPKNYAFKDDELSSLKSLNGSLEVFVDPFDACEGANVIYTDTWVSMGQENEEHVRLKAFSPYKITQELISHAEKDVAVMHCLPAHKGVEIEESIFEKNSQVIFSQVKNRYEAMVGLFSYIANKED